ncbi:hypothetical protein NC652_025045 [Populus alba x Populus x berolinensis]|nr:hypothetical protein NC652_025033 [Populus alba x Populus x berolinensis]KAJ6898408.1 hypothetical protein NC652_025045 [Populus alba x Populus x berolinensis]
MVTVKIKGGSGWYLSSRVVGGKDDELLLLKLMMVLVWHGGNHKEEEAIVSRPPWGWGVDGVGCGRVTVLLIVVGSNDGSELEEREAVKGVGDDGQ